MIVFVDFVKKRLRLWGITKNLLCGKKSLISWFLIINKCHESALFLKTNLGLELLNLKKKINDWKLLDKPKRKKLPQPYRNLMLVVNAYSRVVSLLVGLLKNLVLSLHNLTKMVNCLPSTLGCPMQQLAFLVVYFNLLLDALVSLVRPYVLPFIQMAVVIYQTSELSFLTCC